MGQEAEGRAGTKEKEEKEEQIMCERIGHRPLRGRCPKRNARGKKRKRMIRKEEKMAEQKSSTYRQTDR